MKIVFISKTDIFTHIISPGQMIKTIPETVPQVLARCEGFSFQPAGRYFVGSHKLQSVNLGLQRQAFGFSVDVSCLLDEDTRF